MARYAAYYWIHVNYYASLSGTKNVAREGRNITWFPELSDKRK